MKTSAIVKLNFMILGLALTLYAIYTLNSHGLNPRVRALLGLSQEDGSTEKSFHINWCSTRVIGLIQPEKLKVSQEGQNWVREDNGSNSVVDFIAMEKWLARSCSVQAKKVNTTVTSASFLPTLFVKFVDGEVDVIRRNSQGVYLWRGQTFTSLDFDSAVAELSRLPNGQRK